MTSPRIARPPAPAWALLAPVMAAAACAPLADRMGASLVHDLRIGAAYDPAMLRAGAPLRVIGTPPDGAAPEETARAARLPARLGGRAPALLAPGAPAPAVFMALSFAPGVGAEAACAKTPPTPQPSTAPQSTALQSTAARPGPLRALFALCVGGRPAVEARLRSAATRGPRDAGFSRAMTQLFLAALPERNPALTRPPR
ncbi:hypothetical protein [Oceanicella actignis]|uniref:hypothetical protein n=1 Tax=Oceanicella actignis TaxID=1189325 RepID=UPI0011E82660|nr:hypothetical protein [Oceanicella actignis]TYO89978.1 hypothetical protein LY05_01173 [Oceanicella actignis]